MSGYEGSLLEGNSQMPVCTWYFALCTLFTSETRYQVARTASEQRTKHQVLSTSSISFSTQSRGPFAVTLCDTRRLRCLRRSRATEFAVCLALWFRRSSAWSTCAGHSAQTKPFAASFFLRSSLCR